jgi:hypothetical protein
LALFEAAHSERTRAPAEAIWALWDEPGRWPEWDERLQSAELDGELAVGAELRLKLRKGGTTRYDVLELQPGRLLLTETRFPGARVGHEQRVEADPKGGAEITHRLYVEGPLWVLWALMLGRKRMRTQVASFVERERELVEPSERQPKRKRRR